MQTYQHGERLFFEVFFAQTEALGDQVAVISCEPGSGAWAEMSWSEYGRRVRALAGWLQQQGISAGDRIAIFAGNRPEWIIADLATMAVGAISVPIYATSAAKDLSFILEHSQSKLIFVDHVKRAKNLEGIARKPVVLMDSPSAEEKDGLRLETIYYYPNIVSENLRFNEVKVSPNDVATIVYTSGTTGTPKGVVHTHGNMRAVMHSLHPVLQAPAGSPRDRYFSFLPLSHVAERILVEVGSIMTGSEVVFARGIDALMEDLQRWRPTILLCVPRLWEKIYEKIQAGLRQASPLKRYLFSLAARLGSVRVKNRRAYRRFNANLAARLSDLLVGRTMRKKLGMDRLRTAATGSAPTRPEIMAFFASFGIFIREVYGMTENLCLGTLNDDSETVFGSCGKIFLGGEMKTAPDGEICFRAPWNFTGYYLNDEATRETIIDGWVHTGDLGRIDDEGRLWIEGRKKELLKTSGGKYVAPIPIENRLKESPFVAEAMLVGDDMKFCVALVSIDPEFASADGKEQLLNELRQHLDSINKNLASYESVKRIGVLRQGFSVENGTLTPTLKVKRKEVMKQYAAFIDKVYSAAETIVRE